MKTLPKLTASLAATEKKLQMKKEVEEKKVGNMANPTRLVKVCNPAKELA